MIFADPAATIPLNFAVRRTVPDQPPLARQPEVGSRSGMGKIKQPKLPMR
jgi:hypothetical protein